MQQKRMRIEEGNTTFNVVLPPEQARRITDMIRASRMTWLDRLAEKWHANYEIRMIVAMLLCFLMIMVIVFMWHLAGKLY